MEYGENELDRAEEIIRRHFSKILNTDDGGSIGWALSLLLQTSSDIRCTDFFKTGCECCD